MGFGIFTATVFRELYVKFTVKILEIIAVHGEALGKLRQEDHEWEVSLHYTVSPVSKQPVSILCWKTRDKQIIPNYVPSPFFLIWSLLNFLRANDKAQ